MPVTRLLVMLSLVAFASIASAHSMDVHALPLGDGKVSSAPRTGYVYSCRLHFRGGGAQHRGDWIHGASWDATQKIHVQGDVAWANARFQIVNNPTTRDIIGNDLPVDATTGIFPIQPGDPAYQIDRNPNAVAQQTIRLSLPREPRFAAAPSCVPMGMVGVLLNGVALFNALDDAGRDAVAHEVQDHCNGHPQHRGEYHYHGPSPCIPGIRGRAQLIGYALDGFGIYSMYDEDGRELTNQDLDACHGISSPVMWDGRRITMYHYVMTREYPYSVGCFKGTPVAAMQNSGPRHRRADRRGGRRGPPPEAVSVCADQQRGDVCRFTTPRGDMIQGSCQSPGGQLACVPRDRF